MSAPYIHHAKMEELEWFHPGLTRHQAECILMQNGSEGSYLLRPSAKEGVLYVVSVKGKDSVKHFPITGSNNEMTFGMATFATVRDLLKHFSDRPLVAGETGVLTVLKSPYPRDIEESGAYEHIRVHASLGKSLSVHKPSHLALGSKEGFLTKRGGRVKNWKTRWFVLVKNELAYFRECSDKRPVRTMDLAECSECLRVSENEIGKSNCFRLVFPFRTFYMYACSAEEMYEWFDLINWKLDMIRKENPPTSTLPHAPTTH